MKALFEKGLELVKSITKNKFKKLMFKIMVPYGAFVVLILILLSATFELFTGDKITPNLSSEETKEVQAYIDEKVAQYTSKDYYFLDNQHLLRAEHVEKYLRFLVSNSQVSAKSSVKQLKKKVDEIVDKTLKPDLKYSEAQIITRRFYKEKVGEGDDARYVEKVDETVDTIYLLDYANSIYNTNKYIYEIKTEVTKIDSDERIEITKPVLSTQENEGEPYDHFREILIKENHVGENDVNMVIGMIINSGSDKKWNWLFGNTLAPYYPGGGQWGELVGVPGELASFFDEASQLTGLPNWVLAGFAKQESNFNPNCQYGGAYGIMQFQKYDTDGSDIWAEHMRKGMGDLFKQAGYSFSSSEQMWSIFLKDARAQIIAGAFEARFYFNYALFRLESMTGIACPNKKNYNTNEYVNQIKWDSDENDPKFKDLLRRAFVLYNVGQGRGMSVNLDKAPHDYPNKVYHYAIEFRNTSISGGSSSEKVNRIISIMRKQLGKPYLWAAEGPNSFDCSGLMLYCFNQAGVKGLPRTSKAQCAASTPISFEQLQPGDFVFVHEKGQSLTNPWNVHHVQMYIGGGKVIEAPESGKDVRITDMRKGPVSYGRFPGLK